MNATEYKTVIDFESSLNPGDTVKVRWTNCKRYFSGEARVVKNNRKSFRVELLAPVHIEGQSYYPAGQTITVPNIDDMFRWSANNRVEPVEGYK